MPEDQFTVSELNQFIRVVLNAGFPQAVWVCGEIQGYNRQKNKTHIFFQLTEKEEQTNDTKATIDLVIWGSRKRDVFQVLTRSENSFELEDGIEVKFLCKVDFYPPHGRVRLTVEAIDPVYTLGKLAQEKQKLITELKKKGVLDKNKQLTLPLVPLRIGLITSHDSAAYNDFRHELEMSKIGFQVFLRNSLMQGQRAEKDICQAFDELIKLKLDVIVITRGGGSVSDLSCFDSKLIAEKIAGSKVPILSGIGHEIDLSVTDLAAYTFAKTPTAIARFIIECVAIFQNLLDEKFLLITEAADERISQEKRKIQDFAGVVQKGTLEYLRDHREGLVRYLEILKRIPMSLLKNQDEKLSQYRLVLLSKPFSFLSHQQSQLKGFQKMIDIARPENTLRRGFSITRRKDKTLVRDVNLLITDEEITTELVSGKIISKVVQKKEGG